MDRSVVASPSLPLQQARSSNPGKWLLTTLLFALTYIVCALATTVPLSRTAEGLPGNTWMSQAIITIGTFFHFPTDMHLLQDHLVSQTATCFSEFLLLLIIIFASYIMYAFYLNRLQEGLLQSHRHIILLVIGITTVVVACIYIFTPVTLSEDVYLYADYGRILVFHHANPYFVTPIYFPHDPVLPFVFWKYIPAIYGPVWMLVCAFLTSFSETVPLHIFIIFRIFACVTHLINAFLVLSILRVQGHSIRTILLGTFLYALNPLILFESSLGGHNDVLVATFMLLGIFYAVRAERKKEVHIFHYIPALIALTLAALVKFTILPIIVLFIVMLFFKASLSPKIRVLPTSKRLLSALSTMFLASVLCTALAVLFYAPFWSGHSMKAIAYIFSSQPPVIYGFSSLLSIAQLWNYSHPFPVTLASLTRIHTWNIITYGGMALVMLLGGMRLRRAPTTQNVIFITLGTLAVFLLTTNWFTPWYVIWLLSLTVISLSVHGNLNRPIVYIKWALIAFAFTFSFSAFITYNSFAWYESRMYPPQYSWLTLSFFVTFLLPILAFLLFLARKPGPQRYQ